MEISRVDRQFLDEALRRLAEDATYRPEDWTDDEVNAYRRLVNCALASQVDADLWNMRSLRITPDAEDPTQGHATLSSGRVVALTFKSSEGPVAFELLHPETDKP